MNKAKQLVNELIEFKQGPQELSKLVRYRVTGNFEGPPPPPPDDGDSSGPWSGGNDGIRGVSWTELPDGNLQITITDPELQAEVAEKVAEGNTSDALLADVLEPVTSNGLSWVRPEDVGAMTDSPMLGDVSYDDNGDLEPGEAKIWWYPDYQVRSPLQDLAERGRTVFKKSHPG